MLHRITAGSQSMGLNLVHEEVEFMSRRAIISVLACLIESPRILVTSVVSKRRHMLRNGCQNSLQLAAPIHICVIFSRGG